MRRPAVSFIVPCYKLAHLLPDCLESILRQSFQDFEVFVMDDCSPDHTASVARSFEDPRIRYVRNESNIGHLRNYNKGITLSQGKYVWLISADDFLRRPYVLKRYVDLLNRHPRVGYVFCPGFGVRDGAETRVLGRYEYRRDRDRVFNGHALLTKLLRSNFILAPSSLVRRECYDKLGLFELGFPWCGDWYLWCLFALHYDVAYCAEPMVCYREHHQLSMTTKLTGEKLEACAAEEIAVVWAIREHALDAGYAELAAQCLLAIAETYGRIMASDRYREVECFMNFDYFEASLQGRRMTGTERRTLAAQVLMRVGNECYWNGEHEHAATFYERALRLDPWMMSTRAKLFLLTMGRSGDYVRRALLAHR